MKLEINKQYKRDEIPKYFGLELLNISTNLKNNLLLLSVKFSLVPHLENPWHGLPPNNKSILSVHNE